MFASLSHSKVVLQRTAVINSIQDSASFHFNDELSLLNCQSYLRKTHDLALRLKLCFKTKPNRILIPRKNSVFAIPNETGQFEIGSSNAYFKEKISDSEVAKVMPSGDDSPESSIHPDKQKDILDKLKTIYLHLLTSHQWNAASLKKCDGTYLISGINLIHYLAVRSLDIEQLKEDLLCITLLNLDVINPYVLPGLTVCIRTLESTLMHSLNSEGKLDVTSTQQIATIYKDIDLSVGNMKKQAIDNNKRLLGPLQDGRSTHIMVTVDQDALASPSLLPDILMSGATVVRINCAHGSPAIWSEIIRRVRQSSKMLEKPCQILMDLAGPKLRTDKQKEGPCVMKISPRKSAIGELSYPAHVWLAYKGTDPPAHLSPDATIYIDNQGFFSNIELDDLIYFQDGRGKERTLRVSLKLSSYTGIMCECNRTAYILSGTELCVKAKRKQRKQVIGHVVDVPPADQFVRVKAGDLLIISGDSSAERENLLSPTSGFHRISCTSSYLFDSVKPGETIAFNDGRIWGVINGTSPSEIIVSITHAGPRGRKLGPEKSINIPDSRIKFEGLTSKDLMDLEFIASHADMVGVSFIRDVCDIMLVRKELQKLKAQDLGVVLKIETKDGLEKLPQLLLEAIKSPNPLGVMIARGDLAVECGWERLSEAQEEILSICSAAHIPVIWATQVLESLVKSGLPTRAEITDVAAGRRASCIMLNKGKNICEAVTMLDAILHRTSQKVNTSL